MLKDSVQDVLVVPSDALIMDKDGPKIITSISDNEILYSPVTTGLTDGKQTEILAGLDNNEMIYIKKIGVKSNESIISWFMEEKDSPKSIDELTRG